MTATPPHAKRGEENDYNVPGRQLPWKPAGTRLLRWASATGPRARSVASNTARSLRPSSARKITLSTQPYADVSQQGLCIRRRVHDSREVKPVVPQLVNQPLRQVRLSRSVSADEQPDSLVMLDHVPQFQQRAFVRGARKIECAVCVAFKRRSRKAPMNFVHRGIILKLWTRSSVGAAPAPCDAHAVLHRRSRAIRIRFCQSATLACWPTLRP